MDPVSHVRAVAGLSQRRFAAVAGTSQPAIAHYERGAKSPTWRVVHRMGEALGLDCDLHVGPSMTREERRSLHLHRAIAVRVHARPDHVRARARRNLARLRSVHPDAHDLLDEWERILAGDARAIAARLLDPSERGRALRQVTPFAGVLDHSSRAAVYRSFRDVA